MNYYIKKNFMINKLLELFELGGKKNYEFNYSVSEEKNNTLSVDNDNKIINVTIGDPESKDLPIVIEDIIKKLE